MFFFVVNQSAKLRKLPPFMTMSLLRFSFDYAKCERYKETGRYSFPLTINLQPFCEQVLNLPDLDVELDYQSHKPCLDSCSYWSIFSD